MESECRDARGPQQPPGLRSEYTELKRGLAAEHDDLESYSVGKIAFVREVLSIARKDDGIELDFAVLEL